MGGLQSGRVGPPSSGRAGAASGPQSVRLLNSRLPCRVLGLLGEGGQGRVWRVTAGDGELALKWYYPEWASPDQWATLRTLVADGPPAGCFLWPIDLAVAERPGTFGYVMGIRGARYREMFDLLRRRVTPGFRALAATGMNLAQGFLQLHTRGFCYRDISWGNVFFDPATGDVLICDNDNVGVDGMPSSIAGTRLFMAPEIVRGEAVPSTRTDRYSLAVLLFMILTIHHPLLGRRELDLPCLDAPALQQLLADHPTFIFDPDDDSNRPVPGTHDNALAFWPLYPEFVRSLFVRAFTAGLRDANGGRVTEGEWRAALARLRDIVAPCPTCGQENIFEAGAVTCCNPDCGRVLTAPPRLRLASGDVVLGPGARLAPHHLAGRRYDYGEILAEVREHPHFDADGLANRSVETWTATARGGEPQKVPPGATVRILPGLDIDFGTVRGSVVP